MYSFFKFYALPLDFIGRVIYNVMIESVFFMNELTDKLTAGFRRIGLFGLGRSNLALLPYLSGCEVILRSEAVIDRNTLPAWIPNMRIYDGMHAFDDGGEDLLIMSPSVRRERPEFAKFATRGVRFCSDVELFFSLVSAPVYGVSGSDGKSTTTALAEMLAKATYPDATVCGNIGTPCCPLLSPERGAYVCELSSFNLHYFSPRLVRGAITNITENHLNWHDSFDEYIEAKMAIFRNTGEGVINFDDEISRHRAERSRIAAVTATANVSDAKRGFPDADVFAVRDGMIEKNGDPLFPVGAIRRREAHNVKNLLTALALTDGLWTTEWAQSVAECFGGLAHRCEYVGMRRGIEFFNSSIDTTPARTVATLTSLGRRVVIILGGRDKGLDPTPMTAALKKYGCGAVLLGECREKLATALPEGIACRFADDMEEAVERAIDLAEGCSTILLSPAATSFDRYKSFEERGEHFKMIVMNLA